jgi:hypothetical protein
MLGQFTEAAPGGLVAWNRMIPDPCSAGILIKVHARIGGFIESLQIDSALSGKRKSKQ